MLDLPFDADTLGDCILSRYLLADPARVAVLETICGLLDDDGAVGDRARYYVVRSPFRRAVLRGTLVAQGIKVPSWACETHAASTTNRCFIESYRDQYNRHRKQQRQRTDNPAANRLGLALQGLNATGAFTAAAIH